MLASKLLLRRLPMGSMMAMAMAVTKMIRELTEVFVDFIEVFKT